MQLKHLYNDFNLLDDAGQRGMVARYRERRSKEFEEDRITYETKTKKAKRQPVLKLSDAEKILMKKLGLTTAQVRAMKAIQEEE